jgi:hypothetical protein
MALRQTQSGPYYYSLLFVALFCTLLLCSCSKRNFSNPSGAGAGVLSFTMIFDDTAHPRHSMAAVIDCTGLGIATVEAMVYDSNNESIAQGGPWYCDVGQGSISAVPACSERIVMIVAKEADGNTIFSGRQSGIQEGQDR